ncbi:hypothetical protein F4803DRAFT_536878 [Xylaria telfairii]|nr:hypothetical protein F4803DRAFT_536878 [Xylaria telfairii]
MTTPNQKTRRVLPLGFGDLEEKPGYKGLDLRQPPPKASKASRVNILGKHVNIVEGWFDEAEIEAESWDARLETDTHFDLNLIDASIAMLQRKKSENLQAVFPEKVLEGIESVVLSKPSLLTGKPTREAAPIFKALKLDASVLIRVIGLLLHESVREHLKVTGKSCDKKGSDCPLSKLRPKRLSRCQKEQEPHISDLEETDNRSYLHSEIDIEKLVKEDDELREILRKALEEQAISCCLSPLLIPKNFDLVAKENGKIMPLDSFKTLLRLCPDDVFSCMPPNGHTPLQMAVYLYRDPLIAYDDVLSIIQALIERCPSSIFLPRPDSTTAYRLLKGLETLEPGENADARSDAEELLKRACIGYLGGERTGGEREYAHDNMWENKKAFLYWDARSQRQFLLSLLGESARIGKQYIETLVAQSGIKFETVLAFVELPYWNPESPQQAKLQAPQDLNTNTKGDQNASVGPETDPYTALFAWLRSCGVKKIFRIVVDDDGPEAHTNAAIREALQGKGTAEDPTHDFEIDIWDWRKFDICAETVAVAAPGVREVHLYSHGNTAVLRGWACGLSFTKLEKLEKLFIDIYPQNPRDDVDCNEYQAALIQGIKRQCPQLSIKDGICVKNHGYMAPGSRISDKGGNKKKDSKSKQSVGDAKPKKNEWLANLQRFTDILGEMGQRLEAEYADSKKPVVRVALVDDGCKLTELRGIQEGYSFRSPTDTFFVGPCSHGTLMANCIRRVCPNVELVIIRLDDSRRNENQRFTISSCCKALRLALDQDVDIISMSWTFEYKLDDEDDDKREFAKLIEEAARSKKLLFGALSDKVHGMQPLAPAGLPNVIKIGSATTYGKAEGKVAHTKPDFILPGEDAEVSPDQTAQGSSFATAFAAGLAAVVLYCLKIQCVVDSNAQREKALRMARTSSGMKRIFNALSSHKNDKDGMGHFVEPYMTFRAQDIGPSWDERLEAINRIANEILPTDVLREFREF